MFYKPPALHGRVVKGVGHLGHDEATEAGGREFSLHGRVVKGVGHLGHDETMEAGGREFEPRPEPYSRMSFSHLNVPFLQNSELFNFIWNLSSW